MAQDWNRGRGRDHDDHDDRGRRKHKGYKKFKTIIKKRDFWSPFPSYAYRTFYIPPTVYPAAPYFPGAPIPSIPAPYPFLPVSPYPVFPRPVFPRLPPFGGRPGGGGWGGGDHHGSHYARSYFSLGDIGKTIQDSVGGTANLIQQSVGGTANMIQNRGKENVNNNTGFLGIKPFPDAKGGVPASSNTPSSNPASGCNNCTGSGPGEWGCQIMKWGCEMQSGVGRGFGDNIVPILIVGGVAIGGIFLLTTIAKGSRGFA